MKREPQHYRNTCIFFLWISCCWERIWDKKGKYSSYRRNYQTRETEKLVCALCTSQKEIIPSPRNFNDTFISTNYQISGMRDHSKSECHQRAAREEEHDKA